MARLDLTTLVAFTALLTASACSSSSGDGAGAMTGTAASGGTATDAANGGTTTGGANDGVTDSMGGAANGNVGGAANGESGAPNAVVPYANVTAVAASGSDGDYTFNVTVESSDIDCSEYADWWEVLGTDGSLVYRRIIDHSHTDANGTSDTDAPGNSFTRGGGPVPVAEADVVIVRAHMSVGGYNGDVMRGSVADGFSNAPDIGADFAADAERKDPQPTGCEF